MKFKYFFIFFIFSVFLFSVTGCRNNNSVPFENTTSVNRVNTQISVNNVSNSISSTINHINEIRIAEHEIVEEEIASFSTKLSGKDTPRTRNIGITTSTLDGTTIKNGETFSFCGTIGNPTAEKGYEEADSFDADGHTVKTLGGGNCQVSSTLYNAVLNVSDLQVKERHAHSKEVHYVEKDKDAAVSYGSVDFKFKNNTGSTIKIYANSDLNSVNIRIVKIK